MKTTVRILAVAMALLMVTLALASCGQLSGTYVVEASGMEATMKFSGDKVTMKVAGVEVEGKYKIKGDEITITYEVMGQEVSETSSFEKTKKGIKIDGVEYKKK